MRIRRSIIVCVAVMALSAGSLSGCATNSRHSSSSDDGWFSQDALLIGAAVVITLVAGFAAASQGED